VKDRIILPFNSHMWQMQTIIKLT